VLPFARAALDAVANPRLAVDELVSIMRGQVSITLDGATRTAWPSCSGTASSISP
jgi:hypothetical protein